MALRYGSRYFLWTEFNYCIQRLTPSVKVVTTTCDCILLINSNNNNVLDHRFPNLKIRIFYIKPNTKKSQKINAYNICSIVYIDNSSFFYSVVFPGQFQRPQLLQRSRPQHRGLFSSHWGTVGTTLGNYVLDKHINYLVSNLFYETKWRDEQVVRILVSDTSVYSSRSATALVTLRSTLTSPMCL